MAQFKVGGKVVALEDRLFTNTLGFTVKIVRGSVFDVIGIKKCTCGNVSLDLGFKTSRTPGKIEYSQCHKCGERTETNTWYLRSTTFFPLDEQEFPGVTYTKIIEEVPACAQ